jgi:lipoyl(octanoyl) transferase
MEYASAWDLQTRLFEQAVHQKIQNRSLPEEQQLPTPNFLLFVEHPAVFTLGRSGEKENLLANTELLASKHASYVETNRGGDITFHGPGQLVAYPILDLENFFTDIHLYMRTLEEAVIQTLSDFNIIAGRYPGFTGVWLDADDNEKARKICAMGVKTSRWVTMHGLALNVNTDLTYFDMIVPCGISDKQVTSMQKELGKKIEMELVQNRLLFHLTNLFNMKQIQGEIPELL